MTSISSIGYFNNLCFKGSFEEAQSFLSKNPTLIHCTYNNGNLRSPLHSVCFNRDLNQGHFKIVKLLLSHGANVNAQDVLKETPLYDACGNKHINIDFIKILLDYGANPNIGSYNNKLPINAACWNGRLDIVGLLFDYGSIIPHENFYSPNILMLINTTKVRIMCFKVCVACNL